MKLNKFIIALIMSVFVVNAMAQDTTKINTKNGHRFYISGSEAMFPAVAKIAADYKAKHPFKNNVDYKIQSTGSALGIRNLIERHSDVATSTRPLTKQETEHAKEAKVDLKEFIVAKEAWTIVVNPEAGIYRLTKEEVADIFSGKITNWKQVGGNDIKIHVFIRGNTSGCYKGFKEMFFDDGQEYTDAALQMASNGRIKEQVEKYPGGISYLGYNAYAALIHSGDNDKSLRAIDLSMDKGETFQGPSQMTIDNGSYKFVRNCYLYVNAKTYETYKTFIEMAMSEAAKGYWEDNGFNAIVMKSAKK